MSETPATGVNSGESSEPSSPTTDRIAGMAHDAIDQVAKTANHAAHGMRDAAARTSEAAKHTQDQAATAANESLRKLRLYVEETPLATAGIAFAAGAALLVAWGLVVACVLYLFSRTSIGWPLPALFIAVGHVVLAYYLWHVTVRLSGNLTLPEAIGEETR